jgi:RHS repeat-associated protein
MGSLIAVNLPDGRLIEYITDGKRRRIGKMVNGVLTKQWLYRDQLKPVAELDATGNIISEFIYGTKTNTPDLVIRGGVTYRLVSDQLGSPVLAINTANSGDVPFQATYAAFGDKTLVAGTDDWMPFGFAGGAYDPDTKLTRFGARDYDSRIGRWLNKEPLRFKAGTNFYVYAWDDPINFLDPSGRDPSGAGGASSTGGGGCEGTSSNGKPLTGPGAGSFAPDYCGGSDLTYLTPDGAFGADWSDACKLHDDCYSMCGSNKSTCDQDLNTNVSNSCSWCSPVGNAYQWGVSGKTGQDKYDAAQNQCHP